jgi:hypothetical protein
MKLKHSIIPKYFMAHNKDEIRNWLITHVGKEGIDWYFSKEPIEGVWGNWWHIYFSKSEHKLMYVLKWGDHEDNRPIDPRIEVYE